MSMTLPPWADPSDLVRWGELGSSYPHPDAPVEVNGHPLWRYDHAKAVRLMARLEECGGRARVSADLCHMHAPNKAGQLPPARSLGYDLVLDESLPANSVVAITESD